jgi:DUF4097 and DUF4098 domain-containing protein YvlB
MFRSAALNRIGVLCLGLALLVPALGCDLPLFTASETLSEVFETDAAPKIVVETFSGSIDISNGEDDEVVVEVTRRASGFDQELADKNLEHVEVTMHQDGNTIYVAAKKSSISVIGNCGASIVIAAPKQARIELKASSGYIVAEGMQGDIDAQTSNGKIAVFEGHGTIEANTSNGAIEIEATDAVVNARTSNGRVRFAGSLAAKNNRIRTSNGKIDILLPPDSQFRFAAATSNGRIDCEFPYDHEGSKSRRKKSGTVGDDPKCSLSLTTSNGAIDIRKHDK